MIDPGRTQLAVLGSPIAHSKSPAIHRAAYAALGLDWSYGSAEITGDALADYVGSRGSDWRGLSLTMPLKRDILPLLTWRDPLVDLVGGANTVRITDSGVLGYNTDVRGVTESFAAVGVSSLENVHILGAGATAASVLVAIARLGASRVMVSARTPERASGLETLGELLGVELAVRQWGMQDRSLVAPDAIVSTVPGGADGMVFAEPIRAKSVLFDVSYDPWPSELARAWGEARGTVISGFDLLVNQAVGQIRIFLTGDAELPLPDEATVIEAMRAAL